MIDVRGTTPGQVALGYIGKPTEQANKQHPSVASVGCQEIGLGTLSSQAALRGKALQFKATSTRRRTAPLCWYGGLRVCGSCGPSRTLQFTKALQEGFQALEGQLSDRKLSGRGER